MSMNQYDADQGDRTLDQNDRNLAVLGREGGETTAEGQAGKDGQEETAIEAFDEEGAGIAPKE